MRVIVWFDLFLADGTCEMVTCDPNADCNRTFPSGRRQCICKLGWQGDGRTCSGTFIVVILNTVLAFPRSRSLSGVGAFNEVLQA